MSLRRLGMIIIINENQSREPAFDSSGCEVFIVAPAHRVRLASLQLRLLLLSDA